VPTLEVRRDDAERRYELLEDRAVVGFIDFTRDGERVTLVHTEVLEPLRRRGYAAKLVKYALDDLGARGLLVVPKCPFVAHYIESHPEYAGLVT